MLEAPELRRFFDPAQYLRALNEVEFALPDGSVGRIDRLVETAEGWWVLDYKSGRPDAACWTGYRSQMEGYRAALTSLVPGHTGALRPGFPIAAGWKFRGLTLFPGSAID
jgi:ATP-dependent exoDNAse (exonuclease V) beta subunit